MTWPFNVQFLFLFYKMTYYFSWWRQEAQFASFALKIKNPGTPPPSMRDERNKNSQANQKM